jgi:ComF family protein
VDTQKIGNYAQRFLDLVFPPHCGGCKRNGSVLCASCASQFVSYPSTYQPDQRLRLNGLHAACVYQGPLRSCIYSLKYEGNVRLASPLGLLLAQTYHASNIQADMIIPVPLHPERQRERGYNQAHLLAKVCAQTVGVPLNTSFLKRIRDTQQQAGLSAHKRYSNVAEAFSCSSSIATKSLVKRRIIVIIDDVSTTGATLEACAAPLFAAGASEVRGLVLARPK